MHSDSDGIRSLNCSWNLLSIVSTDRVQEELIDRALDFLDLPTLIVASFSQIVVLESM